MKKTALYQYLTTLALLLALTSGAIGAVSLKDQIDSLIDSANPNINAGIYVESLKTHEPLYQRNLHRYYIPASTLKIVTSLAALAELGPKYTYATNLYLNESKKVKGGYDLFLEFDGDPTFTTDQLTKLFKQIQKENPGIKLGNLVVDTYAMGRIPPLNPGVLLEDVETCETTPVSAAIIDGNFYDYLLMPAKRVGKPAVLKSKSGLKPPYPIENNTKTVAQGRNTWRSYGFVGGTMRIEGEIEKNKRIELPTRSLKKYLKAHIELALKQSGTSLQGNIVWKPVPPYLKPVATHKSAPLEKMLIDASQRSDNLIFDAVFLKVATRPDVSPVKTWKEAGKRIKRIIHKNFGVDLTHSVIADGSGLSRYNLMTPAQFSSLLIAAFSKPDIGQEFFKTLPVNGGRGTLSMRMTEDNMTEKVHAKTGSMSGVSSLVGDVTTDSNDTLVIVFLMNDFVGPSLKYRNLQDDLCRVLVKQ